MRGTFGAFFDAFRWVGLCFLDVQKFHSTNGKQPCLEFGNLENLVVFLFLFSLEYLT